jgi:hypothetical protein
MQRHDALFRAGAVVAIPQGHGEQIRGEVLTEGARVNAGRWADGMP